MMLSPENKKPSVESPNVRVEIQEREDTAEFKEREERSLLERLRGKTRAWALVSSFVLVTTVTEMINRFSHATEVHAKEHAEKVIRDVESQKRDKTGEALDGSEASEVSEAHEEENEIQQRERVYLEKIHSDPTSFLLWMDEIKNEPFAMKLAQEALKMDPFLFIGHWDRVREAFAHPDALAETMLRADPSMLLQLNDKTLQSFNEIIPKLSDVRLKMAQTIAHLDLSREDKSKLMALIPLFHSGRLRVEDARAVLAHKNTYTKTLIDSINEDSDFAAITIKEELQGAFVQDIYKMNELHNEPAKTRFDVINDLGPKKLYALLVSDSGNPSVGVDPFAYPSTYQGVFDRLLERMEKEKISGSELLSSMSGYRVDDFVAIAIQRGRFEDFLETMEGADQQKLLEELVQTIAKRQDPSSQAGMVADILRQIKNPQHAKAMEDAVRDGFVNAKPGSQTHTAFGILSLLIDPKALWVNESEREGFELSDLSKLDVQELESKDGVVVERYFFYDDEDGATSYANFLKSYEGKPGWKIERKPGYVIVLSTGQGREVNIYANEPSTGPNEDYPDRQDAVEKVLAQQGIEPTVVVHRGHVYHQDSTLERLPASTKLLVLGSCGGYIAVDKVMRDHPDVQVISTKGTGTKLVNDQLLRSLEDTFKGNETIEWEQFWTTMARRMGKDKDFPGYLPPDKHFYPQVSAKIKSGRV